MTIIWTEPAKSDLADIYDFQTQLHGEAKAWMLVQQIVNTAEKRLEGPLTGDMPDFQFEHLGYPYRKLLISGHKVTFRREGQIAYVVRVWDQRRFPDRPLR